MFDIVGDVHGCCDELELLLGQLRAKGGPRPLVFVGDLVDRGPRVLDAIRLVQGLVQDGKAQCVKGNHDDKFARWLDGRKVTISHGIDKSISAVEGLPPSERDELRRFLANLPLYLVLDEGNLVVAHAGIREDMIGRTDSEVRAFCLYGDVTGEMDQYGLPIRRDWAADYRGKAKIVYGHTPVASPVSSNGAINIDTGCCFGGSLTALRYPEMELVQVKSLRQYANPSRPFRV